MPVPPVVSDPNRRTYVLDTSVLLADPAAFLRFAEHEVIVPLVVISELEGKRHHPEIGVFARQSLRILDELRVRYGRLDVPVAVNDEGGTLRVELNHTDPAVLPAGFRTETNDSRILAVAYCLAAEGRNVTLVTRDMPHAGQGGGRRVWSRTSTATARPATRPGPAWRRSTLTDVEVKRLYAGEAVEHATAAELPCHTGLVLHSSTARRSAAYSRTRASASSGVTARRSECEAARPNSASRWTCCSTSRSASCPWADGPVRASRRSRYVPGSSS